MALPRVTANQLTTMEMCVGGVPTGRHTTPVASLIKRGLLIEVELDAPAAIPVPGSRIRVRPSGRERYSGLRRQTVYRLTEIGLEVYNHHRTKRFRKAEQKLKTEFERDLSRARSAQPDATSTGPGRWDGWTPIGNGLYSTQMK